MKTQRLPIGTSDFRELRENQGYYIDKSMFTSGVIQSSSKILLFPRPRRFGKTLNLTMLRHFFEIQDSDSGTLFKGLAFYDTPEFKNHQGKYPVIYLTFKDLKELSWKSLFIRITALLQREFDRHNYLEASELLSRADKTYFRSVLERKAGPEDCADALGRLSEYLFRFHKQKAVILIDEYDTPVYVGYDKGYYEEIISFMRGFLSSGLKDNDCLFKGVLTGVLRVAKESVFSGLNNLGVYTLLDPEFNTAFGFTDLEVRKLLQDYEISDHYDTVAHWYNGYIFGGEEIYNPWSLLNFTASKDKAPRPYWVNTASTELIDALATQGGRELREEVGVLLEDGMIEKPIYDSIVMRDLETGDNLLWSFLLFSGYLKCIKHKGRRKNYLLKIPNEEVKIIYEEMVERWFAMKTSFNQIETMLRALETGDVKLFERMLRKVVLEVMSYHDLSGEPEKVYHALVLGMLVWLSHKYEIRSNRESGYGRYDLMLKPVDRRKQGVVIEFKQVDTEENQTPEKAIQCALEQIEAKAYTAELETSGITTILKLAVVFRGKELWVQAVNTQNK